jgi:TolB-like protein
VASVFPGLPGGTQPVGGLQSQSYTAARESERGHEPLSSRVCFDEFVADLRTRELLRAGRKIPLQQQPFQVLATLLEHSGKLITRDELRQAVWSAETDVDVERGLNKAINRLRSALGDHAESPKFIETLAGRGYRFLVPVSRSIDSLAVLPFRDLSRKSHQNYWSQAVTDELITRLARMGGGARVISRFSSTQFENDDASLHEIAERLGVEGVVEGSVAVSGRRLRVRAHLIHARQDRLLWAASYERGLAEMSELQEQISREIAIHLGSAVSGPETHSRQAAGHPARPAAYQAYLRGRFFWNKRTPADLRNAIKHFEKAVVVDPRFAPAHSGLADAYVMLGVFGVLRPRAACSKARRAATTALDLDPTLGEGHATLGHIGMVYDWDWRAAEHHFQRALHLNFSCSATHLWYGNLFTLSRRYEDAIREVKTARELDPLSLSVCAFLAFVYRRAREFDRAQEACREAIELDPKNPFGHWMLARVFDACGELRKALQSAEMAVQLSEGGLPFAAHLGYALARAGKRTRALSVLQGLQETSARTYVSPYLIGLIYTGLRENDSALKWLRKAYAERAARLTELGDVPFDGLRSDSRFRRLVERMGLPAA